MPIASSIKFNYGSFINITDIVGVIPPLRPAVVTWSRLEPLPYNEDLTDGLQAQIADPLWMMARQWQFGEFQGEDAGSPIWSKLDGDLGRLSRYQPNNTEPVDYQHLQRPLEVFVEQEEIRSLHPRLSAEAGEHFLRLLAAEGLPTARATLRRSFPLDIADENLASPQADAAGHNWQRLFAHRAIDGFELAQVLRSAVPSSGELTTLPDGLQALSLLGEAQVLRAVNRWLSWYQNHLREPDSDVNSAWQPERLEYSFKLSTQLDGTEVMLTADEYADGHLDWFSFKVASAPSLDISTSGAEPTDFSPPPLIPSPVRYPGMPADRYWEFEDARVNLGHLEAGPTDLGRMLLAEYGLVYSNDWFLIPVEMPVGSVFKVNSLKVRDTFGETTTVQPARNHDGTRWTMFSLTDAHKLPQSLKDLFFLPPTLPFRLEGDPLESVSLFRDEMANMAWAVEQTVQGASGLPMDRRMELFTSGVHQRVDVANITADMIYRLMTPVADNWLPFVPVAADSQRALYNFSIGLERRTLLRTMPDGSQEEVHPKGILLRSDLSQPVEDEPALRLFEEEVSREGAHVQRAFQYTRWMDGSRHLWVGRSKRTGRGEGSSGLRFDIATFTSKKAAPLSQPNSLQVSPPQIRLIE
jgi:hypothetical protein